MAKDGKMGKAQKRAYLTGVQRGKEEAAKKAASKGKKKKKK